MALEDDETSDETAQLDSGQTAQINTPHDTTRETGDTQDAPRPTTQAQQDEGDVTVTAGPASGDPAPQSADHPREPLKVTVKRRLAREGRWHGQIELERDEMMRLSKGRFPDKESRQQWVYGELDRLYPPLENASLTQSELANDSSNDRPENASMTQSERANDRPENASLTQSERANDRPENASLTHSDGPIQGLSTLPEAWPELPANASLAAEVGWVQANRLRLVEERPGRATLVHLDRALSPAPSWAALGWLETSTRSYAKFLDVAARATASDDGEAAVVRRERLALEEVRELLAAMLPEGCCQECGQEATV